MPDFTFKGQKPTGEDVSGARQAVSAESLADSLAQDGIIPLSILEHDGKVSSELDLSKYLRRKIKTEELQLFCRQMHTLIKVGIPINIAVTRLIQTTKDKQFKKILEALLVDLNAGRTLEHALSQFPETFSKLFINIIKVGENTGRLDKVFLQLSDYLALEVDTKKKIKETIRYPIIVLSAISIALTIFNIFVIPTFAKMFERAKAELPLATRILMETSWFFTEFWPYILFVFVSSLTAFRWYIKTDKGKLLWHRVILRFPIVGWLVHRIHLSRFCKLFSMMISAGIPVLDAMNLVGEATGNAYLASKIDGIVNYISHGNTVASACMLTEFFPPLVLQMITLGEETGRLDSLLLDVADFYDREIEYDSKRLSDAIEPIVLIAMAVMVLILALGIFLPMWDMMKISK